MKQQYREYQNNQTKSRKERENKYCSYKQIYTNVRLNTFRNKKIIDALNTEAEPTQNHNQMYRQAGLHIQGI